MLLRPLRDRRARPVRDRADDGHRHRVHPRRPRRGGAAVPRGVRPEPGRPATGPTSPWARVEDVVEKLAPYVDLGYRHLIAGMPGGLRRGVDGPVRDRGQAAARAGLVRPSPDRRSTPGHRPRHPRLLLRPEAPHLRLVAARGHVAPAAAAAAGRVLEHPATGVVGADPEAGVSPAAIASTSGAMTRASASPVGSAASVAVPDDDAGEGRAGAPRAARARRSALSVVERRGRRCPRLDRRVPDLAQGARASHAGARATPPRHRVRTPPGRAIDASWARPADREVRDAVVERGQVLLRGAVGPSSSSLLIRSRQRSRSATWAWSTVVAGVGVRVSWVCHLASVTNINALTGYAQRVRM